VLAITRMGRIEDIADLDSRVARLSISDTERLELTELIKRVTIYDPLTMLMNRLGYSERFEEEVSRAERHKRPLSVMMLDIDNFKPYNDTYGHLQGDELLRRLGRVLLHVREEDIAARYGGEEFILAFPDTDIAQATQIAEIIRKNIASMEIKYIGREDARNKKYSKNKGYGQVTVSMGITSFPSITEHADSHLLAQDADIALYAAKEAGRNRVIIHKPY